MRAHGATAGRLVGVGENNQQVDVAILGQGAPQAWGPNTVTRVEVGSDTLCDVYQDVPRQGRYHPVLRLLPDQSNTETGRGAATAAPLLACVGHLGGDRSIAFNGWSFFEVNDKQKGRATQEPPDLTATGLAVLRRPTS